MKLQFKHYPHQSAAVQAVVNCFKGQPFKAGFQYNIDPGQAQQVAVQAELELENTIGFRNATIELSAEELLANINTLQAKELITPSDALNHYREATTGNAKRGNYNPGTPLNLDIEMETGTGKTFCYIQSMFELNKHYGWSKFIIAVPSVAIREGVVKSLAITSDYMALQYNKRIRFFTYNSSRPEEIKSFANDSGINVMVINHQAFNAQPADDAAERTKLSAKNRIYRELDDFQSRRPIDMIKATQPILIIDEPQKMEGPATLKALQEFNALFALRYSATHKTLHNLIHRLDAVSAYNQRLVKRIAVSGVSTNAVSAANAYMYLESIKISRGNPQARLEIIKNTKNEPAKTIVTLECDAAGGTNLYEVSGEVEAYADRYTVNNIVADGVGGGYVEFINGQKIQVGEAQGDVSEEHVRRIQIRETIKTHLEKELLLHARGIKVLSLFFIDHVVNYRDYDREDTKGIYVRIFEDEYKKAIKEFDSQLNLNPAYRDYLLRHTAENTHSGYFSVDRQNRAIDTGGASAADVSTYDLILKKKELLLSFTEPTRFIFSHSALREGWDNPNVFVICMLKNPTFEEGARRQEVGRGLRLAVNQQGVRVEDDTVNQLTVVVNESYANFVRGIQNDIRNNLSFRPRAVNVNLFANRPLFNEAGEELVRDGEKIVITDQQAADIETMLRLYSYIENQQLTEKGVSAVEAGNIADIPPALKELEPTIVKLLYAVHTNSALPTIEDNRQTKVNTLNEANFNKAEFKELWKRINFSADYSINFDSDELIAKAVAEVDRALVIGEQHVLIQRGDQTQAISFETLETAEAFNAAKTERVHVTAAGSTVKYDLLGKIAGLTNLTRQTVAVILAGIHPEKFRLFNSNPETFINKVSQIIREQKSTTMVAGITYDLIENAHKTSIFDVNENQKVKANAQQLSKHIYDYLQSDSDLEEKFAKAMDGEDEVIVYAKLPSSFKIPTPLGPYNPDWAIALNGEKVRHIFFVAETKGSMSSMQLRGSELLKIDYAKKFFKKVAEQAVQGNNKVKYHVVTDYNDLHNLVEPLAEANNS